MKILLTVLNTNMGGITSSAVNFCNELVKRENEVVLLDMSNKYLCDGQLDAKIKKGHLTSSRYWNLQAGMLKSAKGFKKLKLAFLGVIKKITIKSGFWYRLAFKKYNEFGDFDVAIAFRQCAPCYSFVLNKVKAKKKMGFVHGELKYMGDISSWKKYMTKLDKIAYVSNAVREQFVNKYPELKQNACTIYNMFNKEQILGKAEEQCEFVFNKNIKNIVTIARIDLIPEICQLIMKKTNTRFHWYIVGDGPDKEEVQQKIDILDLNSVITLCGAKDNPYCVLSQADFSVLLSKSEAYPMTVIESLLLKKPIVVTNFGSAVEMVEDGKLGLISDFDKQDVADKILKMLDDEEFFENCKKYVMQYKYSNDSAYKQFVEAIVES